MQINSNLRPQNWAGTPKNWTLLLTKSFPFIWILCPILSKVIGLKLSDSSSDDLYLLCRMKFVDDVVNNQAPQFMDMGLLVINKMNESGVLGTPATRIRRLTYVSHWISTDHIFGEATAVLMGAARSDHDYNFRTEFEIWNLTSNLSANFFSIS